MKTYFYLLILMITFSCQKDISSNPNDYLSNDEIATFKSNIVHYFEKLPKKATHRTKRDTTYIDYYTKKAETADLLHYYKNDDGFIYFAVAKIAPSLKLKKVATIGKLKIENDSIFYYEEIARTWKMEVPELKEKSSILFDKIVKGKDVSNYYTKNSQPDFWIEFPDDHTYFDTPARQWKTKQ